MSLGGAHALDLVHSKFRLDGNTWIAKFEDIKSKTSSFLPLAGLKRTCIEKMRNDRIIFETCGDPNEVKMFLRGNNNIPYSEVRVIKPESQPELVAEPVKVEEVKKVVGKDLGKKGISQDERERRRERMKEYWRKKKEGKADDKGK